MNFGNWSDIAKKDIDTVAGYILTGRKADEFGPDSYMYDYIGSKDSKLVILDFGCGIGRNTYGMSEWSSLWEVTGYDCQEMLNNTKQYKELKYPDKEFPKLTFDSNWNVVKERKFDVIYCSLVLQHIPNDIIEYLEDFKVMTKRILVFGRRVVDNKGISTWNIIESVGLIPKYFTFNGKEVPYTSEGDPEEHHFAIYEL